MCTVWEELGREKKRDLHINISNICIPELYWKLAQCAWPQLYINPVNHIHERFWFVFLLVMTPLFHFSPPSLQCNKVLLILRNYFLSPRDSCYRKDSSCTFSLAHLNIQLFFSSPFLIFNSSSLCRSCIKTKIGVPNWTGMVGKYYCSAKIFS